MKDVPGATQRSEAMGPVGERQSGPYFDRDLAASPAPLAPANMDKAVAGA